MFSPENFQKLSPRSLWFLNKSGRTRMRLELDIKDELESPFKKEIIVLPISSFDPDIGKLNLDTVYGPKEF